MIFYRIIIGVFCSFFCLMAFGLAKDLARRGVGCFIATVLASVIMVIVAIATVGLGLMLLGIDLFLLKEYLTLVVNLWTVIGVVSIVMCALYGAYLGASYFNKYDKKI